MSLRNAIAGGGGGGGGDGDSDGDWDEDWDDSFESSEDEEMGFGLFDDFTGDLLSVDEQTKSKRESEPEEEETISTGLDKPRILQHELESLFSAQQQVRWLPPLCQCAWCLLFPHQMAGWIMEDH